MKKQIFLILTFKFDKKLKMNPYNLTLNLFLDILEMSCLTLIDWLVFIANFSRVSAGFYYTTVK